MRILFISTHNLATNPRMLKEIQLALRNGYEVDIICFEFKNWSYDLNLEIIKSLGKAHIRVIPANRKPFLPWLKTVLLEKVLRIAARSFNLRGFYLSQAASRRTILLLEVINSLTGKYDLVIGHNYGAMYPAIKAGKKFKCHCGFDMEDYHPGEGNDSKHQLILKKLIGENLAHFDYVSFASPLIKKRFVKDLGQEGNNWIVILNYFCREEFSEPTVLKKSALQFIWFSQNINYGRGLEQIIPVLEKYHPEVELTLIGNIQEAFYSEHIRDRRGIFIEPPKEQRILHRKLSEFDIGLAVEPGKDENNLLAIGNKLLAYYQAGLFILVSDTPAHSSFFENNNLNAEITEMTSEKLTESIEKLISNKNLIRELKPERFKMAANHNWETESKKLLDHWKNVLS